LSDYLQTTTVKNVKGLAQRWSEDKSRKNFASNLSKYWTGRRIPLPKPFIAAMKTFGLTLPIEF
jgi:hypothetical protein